MRVKARVVQCRKLALAKKVKKSKRQKNRVKNDASDDDSTFGSEAETISNGDSENDDIRSNPDLDALAWKDVLQPKPHYYDRGKQFHGWRDSESTRKRVRRGERHRQRIGREPFVRRQMASR